MSTRNGTLSYLDRRGARVCIRGPLHDLAKRLETLRCEATLRADGCDEEVGGVRYVGDGLSGHDDRRIKWQWWYDRDLQIKP